MNEQQRDHFLELAGLSESDIDEITIPAKAFRDMAEARGKARVSEFWNSLLVELDGARLQAQDQARAEVAALERLADL